MELSAAHDLESSVLFDAGGGGDKQKAIVDLSAASVLMRKMFDYSERATAKFGAADGRLHI